MMQAMIIKAYGNTSPLKAMAVWVRTDSAGITGAWMSIAFARTNVDTSNVILDIADFSMIDLQGNHVHSCEHRLSSTFGIHGAREVGETQGELLNHSYVATQNCYALVQ